MFWGVRQGVPGIRREIFQGSSSVFPAIDFAIEHLGNSRNILDILEGLGSRTPTLLVDIVGMYVYVHVYVYVYV